MAKATRRCIVLVDWWSQFRSEYYRNSQRSLGINSEIALRKLEKIIENRLKLESDQPARWEISFRLYAGWMRGGSPTQVLKDYNKLSDGYAKQRRWGSASKAIMFLPSLIGLARGDSLLADEVGRRKDKSSRVHFPFTSRTECKCPLCNHVQHVANDGFKCERTIEKQVDTSLVADAITLAVSGGNSKIIIVSDDDDILPGLIAGEALGGDIALINTVKKTHKHSSQLSDLICGPEELHI